MPQYRLLALIAGLVGASAAVPAGAEEIGRLVWRSDDPRFGGVSGLEVTESGSRFYAVTDKGFRIEGELGRDGGQLASVRILSFDKLPTSKGEPVSGREIDAEGLALASDGSLLVSFEAISRVARFAPGSSVAANLPRPAFFGQLKVNSGLEALALDEKGVVIAIPERSGVETRPFPLYRFRGGTWDALVQLERKPPFLVTGADFGPDGYLYVLERHFTGIAFASRVRRLKVPERGVVSGETVFVSEPGRYGNLEGISVWQDADGLVRLTMVADDNFHFLQRTEIVEIRLNAEANP